MPIAVAGFLLGCLCLGQLADLPELGMSLSAILAIPLAMKVPLLRFPTAILVGFCWALLVAHNKLATVLPESLEGQDLLVVGNITDIPYYNGKGVKFNMDVDQLLPISITNNDLNLQSREKPAPVYTTKKIRLTWYKDPPVLRSGEHWQFVVRLKQPHGFMNPGGFDYEGWLFRMGFDAVGYVKLGNNQHPLQKSYNNSRLKSADGWTLDRWRQSLTEKIASALRHSDYVGLITALTVGERSRISPEHWQILRSTGTNHLMAISGLHIGMVAGLAFWLFRWLWSRSKRGLVNFPAQKAGALGAILLALIYAGLAGFAIPTQRALIMVVVAMLGILMQRRISASELLASALLGVLILDPFAPMDAGFWLSFAAVTILIYGMSHRLATNGLWWKWGRAQWLIFIGLAPVVTFYFAQLPFVSPVANIVAIPWVSMVTVPLSLTASLLGWIAPTVADGIYIVADYSLRIVWPFLSWLHHHLPAQQMTGSLPVWGMISAVIGVGLVLAPKGVPARWLGFFGFLPLVLPSLGGSPQSRLDNGQMLFTLLDVGQGLSAVIQTKQHVLVYDVGRRFSENFDTGRAVVIPFLLESNLKKVDTLILSHNDGDHVGAADIFMSTFDVGRILATWPVQIPKIPVQDCVKTKSWRWDGILFEVLYPPIGPYAGMGSDNNRSCVLRISTGDHSVLLTGDIESIVERQLIKMAKLNEVTLASELFIVPHHGSKTSSTPGFIDAVNPRIALFAVGHKNRYGFPKTEVLERYLQRGIEILSTSNYGAMTFKLSKDNSTTFVNAHRVDNKRYWHTH